MQLEFHQLDRGGEHLRVQHPQQQKRLLGSLATSGQQTPIVVVAVTGQPNRYRVIDGYKRIAALQQLGRDTVEAVIWAMNEAEALVLDRCLRWSRMESPLEAGWLLAELQQRFGYGLEELARRFDRSVSWVSQRLALVELLPATVQQQVRCGEIAAPVAMKYLVPVARSSIEQCQQMASVFARYRFTSRQAKQLYEAWRCAAPKIRQRILEQPQLFLRVQQQAESEPREDPLAEVLRDLDMVAAISRRANRRLLRAQTERVPVSEECDQLRQKLDVALNELARLRARIPRQDHAGKEEHVESEPTNHDFGTAPSGRQETRDCAGVGYLACERAQSASFQLGPGATVRACREGGSVPVTDPGVVVDLQRESGTSP
jgi:ParB/RepB/Spo0J family partition protein